ncbi:MAG: hypothetical protein ACT4OU_07235 [Hyphomicrobium sp.]
MAWFCVKPIKVCYVPKKCDTGSEIQKTSTKVKCEIKYTPPKLYCLTKVKDCAPKYCKPSFCKPVYNGDA